MAVRFLVASEEPKEVINLQLIQDGDEVHVAQADGDELYLVSFSEAGIRIWPGLEKLGMPMRGEFPKVTKA